MGLIGGVPSRVEAATKAALLALVDQAVTEGLRLRDACRVLQVTERRVNRWQARRTAGALADHPSGGGAVHGLLDEEVEAILELAEQWGQVDRSHRKLAHRGSYLHRVWVSPASVYRVLVAHDLVLPTPPTRAPVQRQPWPDWIDYRPNQVWGSRRNALRPLPGCAVLVRDHRPGDALEAEGLMGLVAARQDGRVDLAADDPSRPILLAVSDIQTRCALDCGSSGR